MVDWKAWRIGRLGGIEIRIDPSWSIIAFLIAYTFAALLISTFEDEPAGVMITLAIGMTVVFFGSVLLHELAHSWLAVARGIVVQDITLFLFGGATRAELETENPTDELVIAAVGPVTSLALAGLLWAATFPLGDGPLRFAVGWLAWVNLALGVFNMLPGFPLDGGRILRSLAWKRTGDLVRATQIASGSGRAIAFVVIGLGALQLLSGALIGGLWLMAIGWFLAQSAQVSYQQVETKELLREVPAGLVMTAGLVHIPADLTIRDAVDRFFMRYDHSAFPVESGDIDTGIISLRTVRRVPQEEWDGTTVAEIQEPLSESCTVRPSAPMDEVYSKLTGDDIHRVLVVDEGAVIGIITPRDLTRWIARSRELGMSRPARFDRTEPTDRSGTGR